MIKIIAFWQNPTWKQCKDSGRRSNRCIALFLLNIRMDGVESDLCPLCGLDSETLQHLYTDAAVSTWTIVGSKNWGGSCIICGLQGPRWTAQLSVVFDMEFISYYIHNTPQYRQIEAAVTKVRKHQSMLTWDGFLQGHWSKEWRKVQALSEKMCGRQSG